MAHFEISDPPISNHKFFRLLVSLIASLKSNDKFYTLLVSLKTKQPWKESQVFGRDSCHGIWSVLFFSPFCSLGFRTKPCNSSLSEGRELGTQLSTSAMLLPNLSSSEWGHDGHGKDGSLGQRSVKQNGDCGILEGTSLLKFGGNLVQALRFRCQDVSRNCTNHDWGCI